jgi:hypothetical protein
MNPFQRPRVVGPETTLAAPVERGVRMALHGEARATANLVVLDQPDVVEALRFHRAPAHVISHGKLVDQAKMRDPRRIVRSARSRERALPRLSRHHPPT